MDAVIYEHVFSVSVRIGSGGEAAYVHEFVIHEIRQVIVGYEIVSAHVNFARNYSGTTIFVSFAVTSGHIEGNVVFRSVEICVLHLDFRILDDHGKPEICVRVYVVRDGSVVDEITPGLEVIRPLSAPPTSGEFRAHGIMAELTSCIDVND